LQRWLQLLLYAQSQGNGSASLLLPRAALRAGLMEALAKHAGMQRGQQDHAFMIGMFSLLETLFGTPLAEIITPLNLAEEVVHALIDGSGPLGGLLNVVSTCEAAPSPALAQALATANIQNADWAAVLVEGARWAVQVSKEA
jgi:EAL and modified HD-GYP domain-containing signal transduction protein